MENCEVKFYYIEERTVDENLKTLFFNVFKTFKTYRYENLELVGKICVTQNSSKISEINKFLDDNKNYVLKTLKDGDNNIVYISNNNKLK